MAVAKSELDRVRAGEKANTIEAQQAAVAGQEAILRQRETHYERIRKLYEKRIIAAKEFEEVQTQRDTASESLRRERQHLESLLDIRKEDLAVLVEGYMDVIVAHQYGFANVVAPMGVAITEKQITQIKKMTRNISLALDPDTAGEDAAMRCVSFENIMDADIKVITLPAGQDPDEVIKADLKVWQVQVEKALPVIDFTIKMIAAKLDVKSSRGKTDLVNKILPIIADVKAGPRQYQYLTSLSVAGTV